MTVGIRSHPYQSQQMATNVLQFANLPGRSVGKSPFVYDEQTVPQALHQPQMSSYKDLLPEQDMDPMAYNAWFNSQSYPLFNTNVMAYPSLYQSNYNDASSTMQGNEHGTMRQNSLPNASLDQFLPEFDYQQVLENLDLTQYENESFCLEDYANLEQVNEDVSVNVAIKHEKSGCDITDGKNLEELENVLNNNILNTNNRVANNVVTESPVSDAGGSNIPKNTNDHTLNEQNLMEILDMYSSPDSEWQSSHYLQNGNQMAASDQTVVKTEQSTNSCDFLQPVSPISDHSDEGLHSIGIQDEELIQMPVSRFNELVLSLPPEQSNLAKDIRRRGKNKQAARLCRKRKIDTISALEQTITQMQDEKSKLLNEQKDILEEIAELKSNIDTMCEMLVKGLNGQNTNLF